MFEEIEVLFGVDGNSLAAMKGGWSSPEPGFCWGIGLESLLVLPRPPSALRYQLVLTVRAHLHRPTLNKQVLIVAVNDLVVSVTEIFEDTTISCEIPQVAVALSDTLKIRLIHPNGAAPRDLGGLPDDRELSVAIERIALTCFGKLLDSSGRKSVIASNGPDPEVSVAPSTNQTPEDAGATGRAM
jgi:hypothetical protein